MPKHGSSKGIALYELGRFSDAITAYDHALMVDPRHAKVYYNKGIALADLGRHQEAIYSYNKAIEIVPCLCTGLLQQGHLAVRYREIR